MIIEEIVKILLENTPLIGAFFIIAGSIKVFFYYKLFGIYIFDFIEIKEVLTQIVNNLFAYFIILSALSILLISEIYLKEIFTYIIPILFSIFSFAFYLQRHKIHLYETILQMILCWVSFTAIKLIHANTLQQSYNSEIIKNKVLLIILITLIIYSVLNAFLEYYKVRYKNYFLKTKLLIEDIDFISTLDKYYIGKTDKFIFIHNTLDKSNEVIPVSLVKKIIFYRV